MSVGDVAARAMAGLTARCCLVVGLGEGLDAEGKKSNQTKVSYHFTLIKIFYKIKIILAAVLSF